MSDFRKKVWYAPNKKEAYGDAEIKAVVLEELKSYFRPELLNRIDEVVVFHGLDEKQIKQIAKIQLAKLTSRLQKMDLNLQIDDNALEFLAKIGFEPVYGARPLKRTIQQDLENPLAKAILAGNYQPGQTIMVSSDGNKLTFN